MEKLPSELKKLIDLVVAKYGGVKGYVYKLVLEYGGRYLLSLYKRLVTNREEKEKQSKDEALVKEASSELVEESKKDGVMSDEDLAKKQESAWRNFVNKLKF